MKKRNYGKLFMYAILLLVIGLLIYYGYRYYKWIKLGRSSGSFIDDVKSIVTEGDIEELSQMPIIPPMPEELEEIESVDEFIEGIQYFRQPTQFGYDLKLLANKKDKLQALSLAQLKRFYQLAKETITQKNDEENAEFMSILEKIYAQ